MRTISPKYVCPNCKNKVDPNDLEEIFHGQLESFLFSDTEIQGHLDKEKLILKDKEELLETRRKEYQKLKHKVDNIFELYHEGQISKEAFKEQHTPIYNAQCQVEVSMTELQGQIDALRMQSLDNVQVLSDAQNLHKQWYSFTQEEKKAIIEAITSSIVAGRQDIIINLSYIPTISPDTSASENDATMQRTPVPADFTITPTKTACAAPAW
ncbi:MAG: hypothetical protein JNJ57_14400 [Saprospiraceae bacterium]|nr:hypothetical protein [Saprospiraceae bacterium]